MPFTEQTKLIIKRKAAFRCCRCHEIGIDVHHVIPQRDGGSDDEDNAAPLCQNCHDRFGDNPQKRKEIRQMRDWWYEIVSEKYRPSIGATQEIIKLGNELKEYLRANSRALSNAVQVSTPPITTSARSTDLLPDLKLTKKYITVDNTGDKDAFAMEISGDSMAPRFRNGDIIVVSPNAQPKNGDACVVRVANQTTCKIVQFDGDLLHLVPINPSYDPLTLRKEDVEFVWKVVRLIAEL